MFIEAGPGESNCIPCQVTGLATRPESHVPTSAPPAPPPPLSSISIQLVCIK